MENWIRKIVRDEFAAFLKETGQTDYSYAKLGFPRRLVFRRIVNDDFHLFLFIKSFNKDDEISFTIGWIYKSEIDVMSPARDVISALEKDACFVALPELLGVEMEPWYKVDLDGDFRKQLREIFQGFMDLAIPYLAKVVQHKLGGA
ncbi:MAG: hypothetical protein ACRC8S_10415 [Fimbriiglobus sp.]